MRLRQSKRELGPGDHVWHMMWYCNYMYCPRSPLMIGPITGFNITIRNLGAVLTSRISPEPSVDVSLDNDLSRVCRILRNV